MSHRDRQRYLFRAQLLLAVCTLALIGRGLQQAVAARDSAGKFLRLKLEEHSRLSGQSPAPTTESRRAVALARRAMDEKLADALTAVNTTAAALPADTLSTAGIYFDFVGFTHRMRILALREQVKLRPDEHFGFATYAQVEPGQQLRETVALQAILTERLMATLVSSHPDALLAVQREQPRALLQRIAPDLAKLPTDTASVIAMPAREDPADHFATGRSSARTIPGWPGSSLFRLEFTGRTQELRNFLNALAVFPHPVAVRRVEVAPLGGADPANAAAGPTSTARVTSGQPPGEFSRFAVVVEIAGRFESQAQKSP